jgi:bifunctional oligoribonuclease and PAP phosphatase NrnA
MRLTLAQTADVLREHEKFILTSHEASDPDGIGAELALAKTLTAMGKRVRIINSDPLSLRFAFMDPEKIVGSLSAPFDLESMLADSVLIILDTNDIYNTGKFRDFLIAHPNYPIIIDHHEPKTEPEGSAFIDTDAAATCQIVFGLIGLLETPIPLGVAEALYTGIVYDTGFFSYPKTTATTFAAALELARIGVNPNRVFHSLSENGSLESLMLFKAVLGTLELHAGGMIAVQTMTREALIQTGALYEDADGIINTPLSCGGVEVSVLFKQNKEGLLRCSLRSKGAVNVARIAQGFGGGGHKTAAGFKCQEPLDTMKLKVLEKIERSRE